MKRELHVRFCERLEGEIPSCLLSVGSLCVLRGKNVSVHVIKIKHIEIHIQLFQLDDVQ